MKRSRRVFIGLGLIIFTIFVDYVSVHLLWMRGLNYGEQYPVLEVALITGSIMALGFGVILIFSSFVKGEK